jgi:hypothetical protein
MKKYSLLILIAGLAVLIYTQQKFIMPFVLDVVKSDLFLVESKDQASQLPVSTSLTDLAYLHCNSHIKSEFGSDLSLSFPEKAINVWTLGNYHYVVNGEVNVTLNDTSTSNTKKYVCRIDYDNGDNQEGALEFDNWSIEGIDGLDNIGDS